VQVSRFFILKFFAVTRTSETFFPQKEKKAANSPPDQNIPGSNPDISTS
jgi:hypothetical protein